VSATLSEDVTVTCEAVPVQVQGRLRDGRYFYFRARGRRAQLGVAHDYEHAVWMTVWHGAAPFDCDGVYLWDALHPPGYYVHRDLSHLGEFGAGCIELSEAFALLREMARSVPDAA
jgi:hypothetical protein